MSTNTETHANPTTSTTPEQSPSAAFHDLTAFQRDMLVVLAAHDASTGVEISDDLEDYYVEVEHSRFYSAINRLVDKSIVDKRSKNRRANIYELSEFGTRVLAAGTRFKTTMHEATQ